MSKKLSELTNVDTLLTKLLTNNVVKVTVETPDEFRNLVKKLRENDIKFYTYQLKTERPFKVVIRNLHSLTDVEEIKTALKAIGHDV